MSHVQYILNQKLHRQDFWLNRMYVYKIIQVILTLLEARLNLS